jgi:flagellar FliL protein
MAEKKKGEAQESGKNNNKMLMMVVVAIILAAGVVAAAYFLGTGQSAATPAPVGSEVSSGTGASSIIGPMVDIEPFIVNILDNDGTRYLKAAMTLEVEGSGTEEIDKRMPQLRDAVLLVAGNKTYDELRDLQGKLQLRAEMLGRINEILRNSRVKRIYFTEFVVQ